MSEKNKVLVEAQPYYIEAQSSPEDNRYVFAYTVTITNVGSSAAKLLTRHWLITDANGKVQEVNGEGVVGEHPHLNPGDSFRYTSAAMIETPVGVMQGKYQMQADNGESFNANIPKFTLSIPRTLH
ncbi:Co2+/Mg2+ efflux protein ApaG [Methylomonas sp. MED-D]|uniref:Protein ApaG n=1 Tax=Methylomonas koyamae TaxID=702114 RepID=A0A177NWV1_9GAMM|nr:MULTISPECIES: Co2+/Mg2+ efflux protein ApaG [Methylomonas]NJA05886.1 Co2+/Mg2+ efflux protein ApaG [Methylococcaceae bacterium WWC4]MDT4330508.1 Co2+/Mg2+ efflux protein ApaG [Methylomonas sp. MV1]OAI22411.1 Co2+/Mg2+ efflux protein ApaG [Methylomonas koyamae]OHX34859.1 Co2+/Mg2+ efflux protein ApaG [Methylomonas sp. LWB]WGS86361.1 Co2+/Mg2+ efflux protein ApaG [Methylomonas sp. UP202]